MSVSIRVDRLDYKDNCRIESKHLHRQQLVQVHDLLALFSYLGTPLVVHVPCRIIKHLSLAAAASLMYQMYQSSTDVTEFNLLVA